MKEIMLCLPFKIPFRGDLSALYSFNSAVSRINKAPRGVKVPKTAFCTSTAPHENAALVHFLTHFQPRDSILSSLSVRYSISITLAPPKMESYHSS